MLKLNLKLQCLNLVYVITVTHMYLLKELVDDTSADDADANNKIKKMFKICAPFTDRINEIINIQVDHAKYINIVMPMYNLMEYSNSHPETSGSLLKYCKEIPAVKNNGNIVHFDEANATHSFNSKTKITGKTNDDKENNVETMVLLKCLRNFRRALKILLMNCEVNLILTWPTNCVIVYTDVANQGAIFSITETKFYAPVVTLSPQDNADLLPQLKSGLKRTINWNKYRAKPEPLAQNPNLNHLFKTSFQEVNRLFVLAFDGDRQRTSNIKC